ncbi:apicomplexan specific [Cryptosporidium sp. chipmunk genotype I]|uniref:apicomplexan specific n=1 Tax=Cryptosporidium sp. chipmunk genotype I TaxID=1280935 RepID=UPI00351A0808|nr:apicomplexan specific [Cryptosporidium sp. chipmunk genotype I]
MPEKGGVVLKIKHAAENYNEDKKDGKAVAKKQIELEQNAARAIMNLRHRRDCNGEVTRFSWCSDPLCRMWYDMTQFFGFLGEDVIDTDIDNAIISVADGGSGIYERLIVLGYRILDATGKEYAVKKYMNSGIDGMPKEINKLVGESNKKLLVFLKMRWLSNNICSVECLSKFAKRYCHYCKAELNSDSNKWDDIKLSKYVKFCISFCIYGQGIIDWNNPLNIENKLCQRFPWLEVLIRSMDMGILNPSMQEDGKFLSSEGIRNAKILGILHRHFGYNRGKKDIPPRVLFALNTPEGSQLPEEKTGQMIFSHYISHYFKAVATEHGFTGIDTLHWVEKEKNILLRSNALELFALIDLELGEIYSNGVSSKIEEKFSRYRGLFFSLIANMFVLCEDDKSAQMWLQELVTCVRQVQLYIIEFHEFINSESMQKVNSIPQNEVFTISETSLDHTHVPDIFTDLEPEEIISFISLLEKCKSPAIVDSLREIASSSKNCINVVTEIATIPQKWIKDAIIKFAKFSRHEAKKRIRKCDNFNLFGESCNVESDSNESEHSANANLKKCGDKNKKTVPKGSKQNISNKNVDLNLKANNSKNIHCAEALCPILKPVTFKTHNDNLGIEIQPVSLTFIDEEGNPVHYTLNPNSSTIPNGIVKPIGEIVNENTKDNIIKDNENSTPKSKSLHVFSRNIGRSRSPNRKSFERREHGVFICGDTSYNIEENNNLLRVYKDNRDYIKFSGYNTNDFPIKNSYYHL